MTEQTATALPPVVDQQTWRAALDDLRKREKAATRELDAIAAQRRRLPMVEMPDYTLIGEDGPRPSGRRVRWQAHSSSSTTTCGTTARNGSAAAAPASRRSGPDWSSSTASTPASSSSPTGPSTRHWPTRPRSATRWSGTHRPRAPSAPTSTHRPARDSRSTCSFATATRSTAPGTPTAAAPSNSRYTFALIDLLPWGRQEEWQDSPEGWPQSPTWSNWLDSPDIAQAYGPNGGPK